MAANSGRNSEYGHFTFGLGFVATQRSTTLEYI